MFRQDNFLQRTMNRYNLYSKSNTILPVHTPGDKTKCKDFDVDKVDLRLGVKLPKIDNKNDKKKDKVLLGDRNV